MRKLVAQWVLLGVIALTAYRTLTQPQMQKIVFLVLTLFAVLAYTDYRRKLLDQSEVNAGDSEARRDEAV
jgi:membrane protein implicated in regulation of membrane protease activity